VCDHCNEHNPGVSPQQVDIPDFRIVGNEIERKFQHFLNATVRSGSFYQMNTHPLHFRDDHWVITQNGFACVGFAGCFLGYWFNFNEDFDAGIWDRIGPGIQHVFHESINTASHPGLREFVDEEDASEREFYGGNYYVSMVGTIADYINNGHLRFVRRVGNSIFYEFKWDPSVFNDFNVAGIGSHHVILYVKRGEGGENDPPSDDDTRNKVFRLAADYPVGGPTTWEEEGRKMRIRICPNGNSHHTRHRGPAVQSITLSPDAEETDMATINGWLRGQHVTLPMEIPNADHDWKHACGSIFVVWKLKNLESNGCAPSIPDSHSSIPANLPKRIENTAPGGVGDVPIPDLTDIRIMNQVDGTWRLVQGEFFVRGRENIKIIIESTGVDNNTPITIEVFDYNGDEKLSLGEFQTQGNTTEIVAELENYIVPNSPNNQIYLQASIYNQELSIQSDFIYYEAGEPIE